MPSVDRKRRDFEDGGDRRFILVEMEPEIARTITSERLKRAIEGYEWTGQRGKVNREEGLAAAFASAS